MFKSLSDKRKPETIEFEAEKRLIDTLKLYEEVKHKLECRDVEISQLKKRLQNFIYSGMCTISSLSTRTQVSYGG